MKTNLIMKWTQQKPRQKIYDKIFRNILLLVQTQCFQFHLDESGSTALFTRYRNS